ncbi:MAG TPA: hypothetical protein VEB66_15350 [Opitutaceae bacterium]|nr:hypothetical protein [Opitutaceae bacterium]
MKIFFRNVAAVATGLVIGGCVNMGVVLAGPHVVPPPAGVDPRDAASIAAGIHLFAPRHFVFPFLAHALGTFAGALVAHLLATNRRDFYAWAIGVVYLAGGLMACFMIPAPAWFMALDLVGAYLPAAWLAVRLGRRLRKDALPRHARDS